MTRIFWGVILTLIVALAASLGWMRHQSTELGRIRGENTTLTRALQQAAKQREADARVLASRAKENAATARDLAATQASLAAALRAERQWADQPVPDAVQRALGGAE